MKLIERVLKADPKLIQFDLVFICSFLKDVYAASQSVAVFQTCGVVLDLASDATLNSVLDMVHQIISQTLQTLQTPGYISENPDLAEAFLQFLKTVHLSIYYSG